MEVPQVKKTKIFFTYCQWYRDQEWRILSNDFHLFTKMLHAVLITVTPRPRFYFNRPTNNKSKSLFPWGPMPIITAPCIDKNCNMAFASGYPRGIITVVAEY